MQKNIRKISYLFLLFPILFLACGPNTGTNMDSGITLVSSYDTPGRAQKVFVQNRYAYIADGSNGLLILDVANPTFPEFLANMSTPGPALDVFVTDDYYCYVIYQSGQNKQVHIFDISAPENPVLAGNLDSLTTIDMSIFAAEHYAYIAAGDAGFKIFNMVDPTRPHTLGLINGFFSQGKIFVSGTHAYLTYYDISGTYTKLQIINIADRSNPSLEGSLILLPQSANDLFVFNDYAFVALADSGLKIVDVLNPSSPTLVNSYPSYGTANGVFIDGGSVYIADGSNGVQMLNIVDAAQPLFEGSFDTRGYAYDVFVSGGYIFVADGDAGLEILEYLR
jgi:hypothetical protein